MDTPLKARELRALLPSVVRRVRRGERFLVHYRSRPAFRVIPVDDAELSPSPLSKDPLYRAKAIGRARDGRTSEDHDDILYGADQRRR